MLVVDLQLTCKDFNIGANGCSRENCKWKHACSKKVSVFHIILRNAIMRVVIGRTGENLLEAPYEEAMYRGRRLQVRGEERL